MMKVEENFFNMGSSKYYVCTLLLDDQPSPQVDL